MVQTQCNLDNHTDLISLLSVCFNVLLSIRGFSIEHKTAASLWCNSHHEIHLSWLFDFEMEEENLVSERTSAKVMHMV